MDSKVKQYRIRMKVSKNSLTWKIVTDYSKPRGITFKEMVERFIDNYEGKGYKVHNIKAKENIPAKLPPRRTYTCKWN